jgi:methylase of polypeptide subunit release factors
MEIGLGQATEVQRLVEKAGLTEVRLVPDLQGIPRVITALRAV